MKTKPKPRARRMWALYYPFCPAPHIFDSKARAISWAKDYSETVTIPVAVIPLDNPYTLGDSMVSALTAIGVLPKQKKGGRK